MGHAGFRYSDFQIGGLKADKDSDQVGDVLLQGVARDSDVVDAH